MPVVKREKGIVLSLSACIALSANSLQADSISDKIEANVIATTEKVYAIGGSYEFNDNFKLGIGYVQVNDVESKFGVKDKFKGGYVTGEAKTSVFDDNLEVFLDGTYIGGKTDEEKFNISKGIIGGGIKYNFRDFDANVFVGGTSAQSAYVGVEKILGEGFSLTAGVNRDFKFDETSGFVGISYNFGSGFSSNIASSVKNSIQDEFQDKFSAKYPSESKFNPTGDDSSSGSGGDSY